MTSLYNCKHSGDQYKITKFDQDFNVESSYLCDLNLCECPAGHRPSCRHRQMLPKFIQREAIGTLWFLDFDRGGWVQGWKEEPAKDSSAENPTYGGVMSPTVEDISASEALPLQQDEPSPTNLVWLTPSLYNAAEKEGYDMRYYCKQELLPLIEPSTLETVTIASYVEIPEGATLEDIANAFGNLIAAQPLLDQPPQREPIEQKNDLHALRYQGGVAKIGSEPSPSPTIRRRV